MRPLQSRVRQLLERQDFRHWNRDNALVDEEGSPIVWLHGTEAENDFGTFTRWEETSIGFHFGHEHAANVRLVGIYGEDEWGPGTMGMLMPVLVRAYRPLRLPDCLTWDQREVAYELEERGILDEAGVDLVVDSADSHFLLAAIERAGHDAVLYSNVTEGQSQEDSVFVWRAEQIKSVFAETFDLADPRLLPHRPMEAIERYEWLTTADGLKEAKRELNALTEGLGYRK